MIDMKKDNGGRLASTIQMKGSNRMENTFDHEYEFSGDEHFAVSYFGKSSFGNYLDEFGIDVQSERDGKTVTMLTISLITPEQLMNLLQGIFSALEQRAEDLEGFASEAQDRVDELEEVAENLADDIEDERSSAAE